MAYSRYPHKKSRSKLTLIITLLTILGLTAGLTLAYRNRQSSTPSITTEDSSSKSEQSKEAKPYQSVDLQPTIDQWVTKYSADYSIMIYDLQNSQAIGSHNPDETMFAASLYKIYVAYLSLIDFQDGSQNPNDILIAGKTKKECVDAMIRSSDSPCGEAMMADIGQTNLNRRVKELGIKSTTFNGIQTTSDDCASILKMIDARKDLNQENTDFLLDAMLNQDAKFKRGLQTGAPDAKWQTKVGWNENTNYHDIGIMTLPDGRKFAVSILGQGSGSPAPIADFASTIYQALTNN